MNNVFTENWKENLKFAVGIELKNFIKKVTNHDESKKLEDYNYFLTRLSGMYTALIWIAEIPNDGEDITEYFDNLQREAIHKAVNYI